MSMPGTCTSFYRQNEIKTFLDLVTEPDDTVCLFAFHHLLLLRQLMWQSVTSEGITASVLTATPDGHKGGQAHGHNDETDQDHMSGDEARRVSSEVDVGCDDTAAVTAHDLHGDGGATFQAASDVTAVPSQAKWDLRIDAYKRKLELARLVA